MADDKKIVRIDLRASENLTPELLNVLNAYPDLLPSEKIVFGDGSQTSGIALYPISGAVVVTEEEDIIGNITQECQYPFYLIYKVGKGSSSSRIAIKEFLDDLGRWLEVQDYKSYFSSVDVTDISRQTPGYLESREEDGVENWAIYITLFYKKTIEA